MRRLRVGAIDYLNPLPLFAGFEAGMVHADVDWVRGVPAEINAKVAAGEVDVALMSAEAFISQGKNLETFGDACVAAYEHVDSVRLYLKGEVADLDGAAIALTPQSASSVQLLKVLCKEFWKVSPSFDVLSIDQEMSQGWDYDAFLLIGDDCLINREIDGYRSIDLAQAWTYATGLPFVFAVMAIRKEVQGTLAAELFRKGLQQSLDWAIKHPQHLWELGEQKSGLSQDCVSAYLGRLRYRMGPREQRGFERFASLRTER